MDPEVIDSSIKVVNIEEEIKSAYLEYAMSVIVGRALPDIRDGLKPVHRRILWSMNEQGNFHDKKYVKSARIVGDVIGKYHPHGDSPVYGAMVRMAQDFSQHYTLVDGQGNFGSIDGDNAAAYRYTEARMTKIGSYLLKDIEKETVDYGLNYDGSLKEPKVLPSAFPNLLVNGSSGIAVGMSTNIPPHNLTEVVTASLAMIEDPEISITDLIEIVPGPDFPTRGIITNLTGAHLAYKNGKGSFSIKGRVEIEERSKDRQSIIVTELPYQVNKANWISAVASLVKDKVIDGISDIRDESNKKGIRVVVDLKKDSSTDVILNTLYAKTQLKTSFGCNMLAIENGRPIVFTIKKYLRSFLDHRKEIVTRRTVFDLNKAQAREHILLGLDIALNNIDEVVEIIKKASDAHAARVSLCKAFELSKIQAQAILDMKLQKITALETEKIKKELEEIRLKIADLKKILSSDEELYKVIKSELEEILKVFPSPRKTELSTEQDKTFAVEDFIKDEPMIVSISNQGYCKRCHVETYKKQGRGGKGVLGTNTAESEDFTKQMFVVSTLSYMLCFTNKGRLHWLKVHRVPEMKRTAKGRPIIQLLKLSEDEKVLSILPVDKFEEGKYIFFATKKGLVKKTDLMSFSKVRQGGIIAISFEEGDELIGVAITDGENKIFMATCNGQSITFDESNVRSMGRTAKGVKGLSLKGDDIVVGMDILDSEDFEKKATLLTISEGGYGKRTELEEYRSQGRGGSGVRNLKVTEKVGRVCNVLKVYSGDDVVIISDKGKLIRLATDEISCIGRSTQGVRVIKLNNEEKVRAIAVVADPKDEEEGTSEEIVDKDDKN